MAAAPLVVNDAVAVAWDEVWGEYCDLALPGGLPHRGSLLKAPSAETVHAQPGRRLRCITSSIAESG